MGNIHDHAQALHLLHELDSFFCQSKYGVIRSVGWEIAAVRCQAVRIPQLIGIIPGQRHHTDTQMIKETQKHQIALTDSAFLDGKKGRHFPLLPVFLNVIISFYHTDQVFVGLHFFIEGLCQTTGVFKRTFNILKSRKQGKIL